MIWFYAWFRGLRRHQLRESAGSTCDRGLGLDHATRRLAGNSILRRFVSRWIAVKRFDTSFASVIFQCSAGNNAIVLLVR